MSHFAANTDKRSVLCKKLLVQLTQIFFDEQAPALVFCLAVMTWLKEAPILNDENTSCFLSFFYFVYKILF
jgi:hypothetical protein